MESKDISAVTVQYDPDSGQTRREVSKNAKHEEICFNMHYVGGRKGHLEAFKTDWHRMLINKLNKNANLRKKLPVSKVVLCRGR